MIGSYKNRHVSGDPSAEGAQSAGAVSKPASEMQLQVQTQQEELDRLKKDLSSQKVTVLLTRVRPPAASRPREHSRGLWVSSSPEGLFPEALMEAPAPH